MGTVAEVYHEIAEEFSATRMGRPWRGVQRFLEAAEAGSQILEVGCGNGKNLGVRAADCIIHGCDPCAPLLACAQTLQPHAQLVLADGCALPYSDSSMDVVLSVAVLHHLQTVAARRRFLKELVRVWNCRGSCSARALVTVWATDAVKPSWLPGSAPGDYWVPWTQAGGTVVPRYYHVFEREEITTLFKGIVPIKALEFECDNWYVYL
jgi:ubiquinone/menaquinone biosynthesis C-methylase UbiE